MAPRRQPSRKSRQSREQSMPQIRPFKKQIYAHSERIDANGKVVREEIQLTEEIGGDNVNQTVQASQNLEDLFGGNVNANPQISTHPSLNFSTSQLKHFAESKGTIVPNRLSEQAISEVQMTNDQNAQKCKITVTVMLLYALSVEGTILYDQKRFVNEYGSLFKLITEPVFDEIVNKLFPKCFINHYNKYRRESTERINFYTAALYFSSLNSKSIKFLALRLPNFDTKTNQRNRIFMLQDDTSQAMKQHINSIHQRCFPENTESFEEQNQQYCVDIYDEISCYLGADQLKKWKDSLAHEYTRRFRDSSWNSLSKHEQIYNFCCRPDCEPEESSQPMEQSNRFSISQLQEQHREETYIQQSRESKSQQRETTILGKRSRSSALMGEMLVEKKEMKWDEIQRCTPKEAERLPGVDKWIRYIQEYHESKRQ